MNPLKIANGAGFWGDEILASSHLIEKEPTIDFITLDYLAEVSLSIMAIQKEKDPSKGYAEDFLEVIQSLIPFWSKGLKFKVITNGGGLNPEALGKKVKELLQKSGLVQSVYVVLGDDVLELLQNHPLNPLFKNMETHRSLKEEIANLATANAYLGAEPICKALLQGADIVITGRVADPSLTVGPALFHYGWKSTDYQKIAGATIAGHLIECGTQVTGGISTEWLILNSKKPIGFPIAEIFEDGSAVITKPANTGGAVTLLTVKEQLLYELGDPSKYLSPDATVSFLNLEVREVGKDRVEVKGALGSPPPPTYKVSATFKAGFKADATLTLFGDNILEKARLTGELIVEKVKASGFPLAKTLIEWIGAGAVVPGVFPPPKDLKECILRISVADPKRSAVEQFTKTVASMVTAGAQGTTGYISGRGQVRPRFGFWPCLIERESIQTAIKEIL